MGCCNCRNPEIANAFGCIFQRQGIQRVSSSVFCFIEISGKSNIRIIQQIGHIALDRCTIPKMQQNAVFICFHLIGGMLCANGEQGGLFGCYNLNCHKNRSFFFDTSFASQRDFSHTMRTHFFFIREFQTDRWKDLHLTQSCATDTCGRFAGGRPLPE